MRVSTEGKRRLELVCLSLLIGHQFTLWMKESQETQSLVSNRKINSLSFRFRIDVSKERQIEQFNKEVMKTLQAPKCTCTSLTLLSRRIQYLV